MEGKESKSSSTPSQARSQSKLSSAYPSRDDNDDEEEEEEEVQVASDFSTCMFCGKSDKTWNEDALDLHYWKDCPLLYPCQACAQVKNLSFENPLFL